METEEKAPGPSKLADPAFWYWEKCSCGAIIEFEAKTPMAYDKFKAKWDEKHDQHVFPEQWVNPDPAGRPGVDSSTGLTEKQKAVFTPNTSGSGSSAASSPYYTTDIDKQYQVMFDDLVKMRNNGIISIKEYDNRHALLLANQRANKAQML